MNGRVFKVGALAFSVLINTTTCVPGLTQGVMASGGSNGTRCFAVDPEPVAFQEMVQKNLVTSLQKPTSQVVSLRGLVKPNSYPEQVEFLKPSGDAQFDADCLESLLYCNRIDANPLFLYGNWFLSEDQKGIRTFTDKKDEHGLAIFRIPFIVSTKYPRLFSQEELLSKRNIKVLGDPVRDERSLSSSEIKKISDYADCWKEFFTKNPHPTKQAVLREAKRLDNKSKEEVQNLSLRQN